MRAATSGPVMLGDRQHRPGRPPMPARPAIGAARAGIACPTAAGPSPAASLPSPACRACPARRRHRQARRQLRQAAAEHAHHPARPPAAGALAQVDAPASALAIGDPLAAHAAQGWRGPASLSIDCAASAVTICLTISSSTGAIAALGAGANARRPGQRQRGDTSDVLLHARTTSISGPRRARRGPGQQDPVGRIAIAKGGAELLGKGGQRPPRSSAGRRRGSRPRRRHRRCSRPRPARPRRCRAVVRRMLRPEARAPRAHASTATAVAAAGRAHGARPRGRARSMRRPIHLQPAGFPGHRRVADRVGRLGLLQACAEQGRLRRGRRSASRR